MMMRRSSTALVLLAFEFGGAGGVAGQAVGDGVTRCGQWAGATVSGRLVALDAPDQDLSRSVSLRAAGGVDRPSCWTRTPADGSFTFRNVAPGAYEMVVAGLLVPLGLEVERSDIELTVPIRAENLIMECLAVSRCATILSRRTSIEAAAAPAEERELIGYRIALALSSLEVPTDPIPVVCVAGEAVRVRSSLSEIHPDVVPASECGPDASNWSYVHQPTGRPSWMLGVGESHTAGDGTHNVGLSFRAGARWGKSWACRLEARDSRWFPTHCVMTAIL